MKNQSREIGSGLYTFDGGLERVCVCGHTLGIHAAARVKHNGKTYQDCFVDTFTNPEKLKDSADPYEQEVYRHSLTGKECGCVCFKPKKK